MALTGHDSNLGDVLIYFDVTETLLSGLTTGIQRVVRELGFNLTKIREEAAEGIELVYLDSSTMEFYKVDSIAWQNTPNVQDGIIKRNLVDFLVRHRIVLNAVRIFQRTHLFIYAKKRLLDGGRLADLLDKGVITEKRLEVRESDIYFTADSFWNDPKKIFSLRKLSTQGVKIHVFIHDILPITNPEWFERVPAKNFSKCFDLLVDFVDAVYTSSEHVKNEISHRYPNLRTATVIVLGSTLVCGQLNIAVREQRPFSIALAIGTIEPRKNYNQILDWLSSTELDLEVRIVGRRGWKSRMIYRKLSRHNKVKLLGALSDKELEIELSHADFGICASLEEGYGLPLREFLAHGLPVVASDIPPFHEIPKNAPVYYFELSNISSMDLAASKAILIERSYAISFPSWMDSAKELLVEVRR